MDVLEDELENEVLGHTHSVEVPGTRAKDGEHTETVSRASEKHFWVSLEAFDRLKEGMSICASEDGGIR